MKRRSGLRWGLAALAGGGALALWSSFRAAPLPTPPRYAGPVPPAQPPPGVAVVQLPTGVTHRNAAVAYRGGSFADRRDFSMTATLVKHPRGDLLIDTGFGRQIDVQFKAMPQTFRWVTTYDRGEPAADQLQRAGYDFKALAGILLTHAHWDHTSGNPDFADKPVWVTSEEHAFIRSDTFLTVTARMTLDERYQEYAFEGGEYLGFPRSHDFYGDGSIVAVPAPGHTPGSVVVFVTLASGKRYAFVGDLAWQREGITELEERPWITRTFADGDEALVREQLTRMNALVQRFPELVLVPSHDARAFADFPRL